jgi:hypothetical protein
VRLVLPLESLILLLDFVSPRFPSRCTSGTGQPASPG